MVSGGFFVVLVVLVVFGNVCGFRWFSWFLVVLVV